MKRLKPSLTLTLIGLALFLSAAKSVSAPLRNSRPNQHKEKTAEHPAAVQNRNPEPTVPLAAFEASQSALVEALRTVRAQAEAAAKQDRPQYERWYALAAVLAQFALCIIGALYTRYAWKQWAAIKAQADIARDSLIKLQRPWLFIKIDSVPQIKKSKDIPADGATDIIRISFHFMNPTIYPARITESAVRFIRLPNFHLLSDEPNYGPPVPQIVYVDPNGLTDKHTVSLENEFLYRHELVEVEENRSLLFFFGYVKYWDVLEKPHETRFAWHWSIPFAMNEYSGFRPVGPPAYNRHT